MCEIPENFVTSDLVNHLRCNKPIFDLKANPKTKKIWAHPRYMFVFETGDLNLATFYLAEKMHEPFEPFPIACVAVHQSVRDEFIEQLRSRFHQVKPHVATHPNFERTLSELKMGNIKYVVAKNEDAPPFASPILVTDNVIHLFFSSGPSGVVILKSFSTIAEALEIYSTETLTFDAVYLFDESITTVYTLAQGISCLQFYVNCFDVCTMPILPFYSMRQARALLHDGYHFETLEIGRVLKIIVFPYTTSLVRGCICPHGKCNCNPTNKVCNT